MDKEVLGVSDRLVQEFASNPYLARRTEVHKEPTFLERIDRLNKIMELERNDKPTDLGVDRVNEFRRILLDELDELDDIATGHETDRLVDLADLLGDIIVYCASEAKRWGIPILEVLHLIMDSQDSKLVDGKPVPGNLPGKYGKGPHYQPPEPAIKELLFQSYKSPVIDEDKVPVGPGDGLRRRPYEYHYTDYQNHLCPRCKSPISDEAVKQMLQNDTSFRCPACLVVLDAVAEVERPKLTVAHNQ